jgi:hypothetical protein
VEAEQEDDFFFSLSKYRKKEGLYGKSFPLLRRRSIIWTHQVITNRQTNAVKPNLGIANGPKETWR